MTNDEAIIDLSVLAERMDSKNAEIPVFDISLEAVDMAIKALSQQTEDAISRTWLKKAFHNYFQGLVHVVTEEDVQAYIDVAPSVTSKAEPCEEAISRQAAIDAVAFGITYATGVNMETGEVSYPFAESNQELRKAIHRICELPLVTPKQRTGHWIERPEIKTSAPEYLMFYECSECGDRQCFCKLDIHKKHFCNNCGIKMVEPQESEVSE